MLSYRIFAVLTMALMSPAHAGGAQGQMTLDGTTVSLKVSNALALSGSDGTPFTLVLLTEAPLDLSTVLASPEPYLSLINYRPLDAATHAMVFIRGEGVSVNAHKAGKQEQYLASQKFGLEATISGGDGKPLAGKLRSTNPEMSVQIDVSFTTDIMKPDA